MDGGVSLRCAEHVLAKTIRTGETNECSFSGKSDRAA